MEDVQRYVCQSMYNHIDTNKDEISENEDGDEVKYNNNSKIAVEKEDKQASSSSRENGVSVPDSFIFSG